MKQRPVSSALALCVGAGLALLALSWALGASSSSRSSTSDPSPTATGATSGLRAVVDPVTGELREPTAEELARVVDGHPTPRQKSGEPLEVVEHPGGMRSVVLDERFMSTSVARLEGDGQLVTDCLDSPSEVREFLQADRSPVEAEVQ